MLMVIVVNCEIHYITPIGIAALQLETLQNEYAFMLTTIEKRYS